MQKLAIHVFGPLGVTLDEAPVTAFESDKVRALLAYLAIGVDQVHRRESLAALIWSDYPEVRARRNLSQAIYSLRTMLGDREPGQQPILIVTPDTIQLNPENPPWVDLVEFNHLIEACERHPHHLLATCQPCQERLQQAISLYAGDLLEGFYLPDSASYEEWVLVRRERARQRVTRALTNLVASHERQGHLPEALQLARRLAALDPFDESVCQMLLRLLAASGLRSEALSYYENFRSTLSAELNLAPQPETTALYERIRSQTQPEPETFIRRDNLPASLSPLIGRQAELAELQSRLLDPACRLLTLLGPGGVGKSRLALETARGLLGRFADGVFVVYLTPLVSSEAFLPALASALGFKILPTKAPLEQLQDYLRQKELLLVLDGCETLLEGMPTILELMRAAPDLTILATSRARLNLAEEQVFHLGGLECPTPGQQEAADSPAVRLFASGARRVRAGFAIDPLNLPPIMEICCQVQGMPLAILLAAAWVEVFSPAQILAEIRHSPDFLQADWADLPARQRSVRATFDYSWDLLDENGQTVFQALCVFRGRFTRQASEVVSGAGPQRLRRLVDKSLLMPLADEWYIIHNLLQQFGLEKLEAQPPTYREVHQRYSTYYLQKVREWEAGIKGARQLQTLAEMDTKINNLRPAWEWAAQQQEINWLANALEGLCLYYELRARFLEGKSLCQETIAKLATDQGLETRRLLSRLAIWESRYCRLLGELEQARQQLEHSQALADELSDSGLDTREVQALIHLEAAEAVFMADLAQAQRFLERSLVLYRQLGDTWRIAGVLTQMGINRFHASDFLEADRLFASALELYEKLGATLAVVNLQGRIAHNQSRLGEIESALALLRQVAEFSQASGDRAQAMLDLRTLGLALMWNGFWEDAQPVFQQALSIAHDLGNRYEISFINLCLGLETCFSGRYELSHGYHAQSLVLARRDGYQREIACSLFSLGCIAIVEKSPPEAHPLLEESIAHYRQLGDLDELSWSLSLDGYCCLVNGDTEQASRLLNEAIETAYYKHAYFASAIALPVCAVWLEAQDELEKALETFTCVVNQPLWASSKWFHDMYDRHIAACAEGLPPEVAAAARQRGKERQLFSVVEEVYEILKTV